MGKQTGSAGGKGCLVVVVVVVVVVVLLVIDEIGAQSQ